LPGYRGSNAPAKPDRLLAPSFISFWYEWPHVLCNDFQTLSTLMRAALRAAGDKAGSSPRVGIFCSPLKTEGLFSIKLRDRLVFIRG
jgi:hypothetical protein